MALLKQSTTFIRLFKAIDSSDHISKKTGLTPIVDISKAGTLFATAGGSVTEVGQGWYAISLTPTDTNTIGDLAYYVRGTNMDDTDFVDQVTLDFQSGDAYQIVTSGTFGNAQLVRSTTPANKLDVSAGGEAGIDWANIGSASTAQNLSATNIDVDQIVASVSGSVNSVVSSVTSGTTVKTITLVGGTVNQVTGSVGSVVSGVIVTTNNDKIGYFVLGGTTGRVTGNVDGSVNSVTSGVTVTTNNDKVGYFVLGGTTGRVTGNVDGSVGSVTGAVGSVTGAVGSVTGSVGSVVASVTSGTSRLTDASPSGIRAFFLVSGTGYPSAVAGSVVKETADNAGGASLTVQQIVDGVWNETRATHASGGSFGEGVTSVINPVTSGTSVRVITVVGGTINQITGSVGSVTAGVIVTTNNDKTGYFVLGGTTGRVTGNVDGSVGSVVGAVGSVTGAVGSVTGNVGGSVGSVVAPVNLSAGVNVTQYGSGTLPVQTKPGYPSVNIVYITAGTVPTPTITGVPKVDVVFTSGTTPVSMIKKNTIYNGFTFPMIDSSDHITLKSGLTITGTVSIDGSTFGSLTNSASEISSTGIYKVNLAAADVNGTDIMLKFTSAGADTRLIKFTTQT